MTKKTFFHINYKKVLPWASVALFVFAGILLYVTFFGGSAPISPEAEASFRQQDPAEKMRLAREIGDKHGAEKLRAFLGRVYPDEPPDDHEVAHVIGEVAFGKSGYDGFGACDAFMTFACYHGVILEAIRQNGYSDEVMQDTAQGCLDLDRNRTTITACVHGVGHGIMWVRNYDLVGSYKECEDMFTNEEDRFFCYDGVSMEFVVQRGEDILGGDKPREDDPLYPCAQVDEKYQPACVREHTHYVIRQIYNFDIEKTKEYCLQFTGERTHAECFGSIGAALNQMYSNAPQTIINECKKLGEQGTICISRAATHYAYSGLTQKGNTLCEALSGDDVQGCLGAVKFAGEAIE